VIQCQTNAIVEHISGRKSRKAIHAIIFRVQKLRHVQLSKILGLKCALDIYLFAIGSLFRIGWSYFKLFPKGPNVHKADKPVLGNVT
jgi:hypothetical protein